MRYQGDIGLYLSGSPIAVPMCAIYITQPTIKQIVQFGEEQFLMAVQLLSNTEEFLGDIRNEQGNSELRNMSDFQILLVMIQQDSSVKKCIQNLFEIIFPDYKVEYTLNSMDFYLREEEESHMVGQITPFTFPTFQTIIKELFSLRMDGSEGEYNPANAAAKEIADKFKKAKNKRARLEKGSSDKNISIFGTYTSVLAIGMVIDINVLFGYTPFQLYDTFQRY